MTEELTIERALAVVERAKHFDKFSYDEKIHPLEEMVVLNYREAKGFVAGYDSLKSKLAEASRNRCETCEAKLIDNCPLCGAPRCCYQCCKTNHFSEKIIVLETELAAAKKEIESQKHCYLLLNEQREALGKQLEESNALLERVFFGWHHGNELGKYLWREVLVYLYPDQTLKAVMKKIKPSSEASQ